MEKERQITITFDVEPADHSVGIMSEGFSAWTEDGAAWCSLESLETNLVDSAFIWYDGESGDRRKAPDNAALVEAALHAYAHAYYLMDRDEQEGA